MADYDESQQRIDAQLKEAEALLRQADQVRAERDRLFEQSGLSFEAFVEYLNSDQIPEEVREKMREQTEQFEVELAQEQERLAGPKNLQSGPAQRMPMSPDRMV